MKNETTNPIGIKHDAEKPDYSLLSYPFLEDTIRVLMYGAARYGRNNWQHLPDGIRRCASAIMRHTAAILQGELYDPDTSLQHSAHIACEAMFIHHFIRTSCASRTVPADGTAPADGIVDTDALRAPLPYFSLSGVGADSEDSL